MRISNMLSFSQPGAVRPVRGLRHVQALFHEGDQNGWVYEVVSGMLKLSKVTSDGRMLIVDVLVAGDIASLSDIDVYGCTAQAVGETLVRVFPRSILNSVPSQDVALMQRLLKLACRREEVLHQQLLLLSLRHPHQRIAAFLIMMLARQVGEHNLVNGSRIALPMARRDIADHLVLAPETLSRVMRRLREQRSEE